MAGHLFYFNPTCEMAIANGESSYTPPKHLEKFRNDLSLLPIYFADGRDVVVVDEPVSKSFLDELKEFGWNMPLVVKSPEEIPAAFLPLKSFSPWGWSPAVIRRLEPFVPLLEEPLQMHFMRKWTNDHKHMFSRITDQELSQKMKDNLSPNGYLSIPKVPVRVDNISQLIEMEREMLAPILIKTPWSASGRGLFKIRSRAENVGDSNWIKSKFKQQGFLMTEPFLHKIQDLSFHFKKESDQLKFLGTTFFKSEADGRFMGCYIGIPELDLGNDFPLREVIEEASVLLKRSLSVLERITEYEGYIGVDALLFYDDFGEVKLHPSIEVNLRYTMGLLNLFLQKRVDSNSKGFWHIVPLTKLETSAFSQAEKIIVKDGLLVSGKLALTPPPTEGGFVAVLTVD